MRKKKKNYIKYIYIKNIERFDLVSKIAQQDLRVFSDQFDIMRIEDLPKPEIECRENICDLLKIFYKSSL